MVLKSSSPCLSYEANLESVTTELNYKNWCLGNPNIAKDYALPRNPANNYNRDWDSLFSSIKRKKEKH